MTDPFNDTHKIGQGMNRAHALIDWCGREHGGRRRG